MRARAVSIGAQRAARAAVGVMPWNLVRAPVRKAGYNARQSMGIPPKTDVAGRSDAQRINALREMKIRIGRFDRR
ncbi:hypothetical protein [Burkholderia sp. Bp9142]|uniref:hypothetical protein n=1 Tax=Burkholderia sp. Bp9142 TaxID=2184573 RepID=UPI000F5ACA08|nr:hypothetical protein [Burkholderia sp. Bp9142]RQR41456.1 hypothetical protein DIE22_04145 [Burkholderia sp. Bp9142]